MWAAWQRAMDECWRAFCQPSCEQTALHGLMPQLDEVDNCISDKGLRRVRVGGQWSTLDVPTRVHPAICGHVEELVIHSADCSTVQTSSAQSQTQPA